MQITSKLDSILDFCYTKYNGYRHIGCDIYFWVLVIRKFASLNYESVWKVIPTVDCEYLEELRGTGSTSCSGPALPWECLCSEKLS